MPDAPLTVRPATPADFEAIERIAVANEEPTVSVGWPGYFYLGHLHYAAPLRVAEAGGAILGFGRRPPSAGPGPRRTSRTCSWTRTRMGAARAARSCGRCWPPCACPTGTPAAPRSRGR